MSGTIKALILDFDGTLLDSVSVVAMARLETLAESFELPFTPAMREVAIAKLGMTGTTFLCEVFSIGRTLGTEMYRAWEEMDITHPVPLIRGTHETIAWARERQMHLCILSSRYRRTLVHVLKREGLDEYFTRITAHDDDVFRKPNPRALEQILVDLAWYGIAKEKCLVVGDSPYDLEVAREAGIPMVMVKTGHYATHHHKTHPLPASRVIASIAHLPRWIELGERFRK